MTRGTTKAPGSLVIFRGLPGTGKSFVLKKVLLWLEKARKNAGNLDCSSRKGGVVIPSLARVSRDELRALLLHKPTFDANEKEMVDGMLADLAVRLMHKGYMVFVDGCSFTKRAGLMRFVDAADNAGFPWSLIECSCDPRTAIRRIESDAANGTHPAGDRDARLYWRCHDSREDARLPAGNVLGIDTGDEEDPDLNARRVALFILGRQPAPDADRDAKGPAGAARGRTPPGRTRWSDAAAPSIIVHGGAYAIPERHRAQHLRGVRLAARVGYGVLSRGGTAIEACEAAVRVLEDDPVFDAGTGSVLNAAGEVEMDAIICDGTGRDFGAVCALKNTKNPISVARKVLEDTSHCILVGNGATRFARNMCKFPFIPNGALVTPEMSAELGAMERKYERSVKTFYNDVANDDGKRDGHTIGTGHAAKPKAINSRLSGTGVWGRQKFRPPGHDTVGCVCRDAKGNIASATSTGGITAKLPGRVGDSPIFGAGAYADSDVAGISTTGHGESILRVMLAANVVWRLRGRQNDLGRSESAQSSSSVSPLTTIRQSLDSMKSTTGGCGGVILIDSTGECYHWHTTSLMSWASVSKAGVLSSGLTSSLPLTSSSSMTALEEPKSIKAKL